MCRDYIADILKQGNCWLFDCRKYCVKMSSENTSTHSHVSETTNTKLVFPEKIAVLAMQQNNIKLKFRDFFFFYVKVLAIASVFSKLLHI